MASPTFRFLAAAALAVAATMLSVPGAQASTPLTVSTRWTSNADFARGSARGLTISNGALTMAKPAGTFRYADPYGDKVVRRLAWSEWISPWTGTAFKARTIIPSWNVASAPNGTFIRVEMRGKVGARTGSWDTIADWGYGLAGTHRNSGTPQTDDFSAVDVDTMVTNGSYRYNAWQIRLLLIRPEGSTLTPRLTSIGAVAASYVTRSQPVSRTTMTTAVELAVPRHSQMIHRGQFPQYGGGGTSWCSPTSTSMVLRYFKTGPTADQYAWSSYPDSFVDHAARYSYDYRYRGAGNWPFNTAYAALFGLDAFVTRLYDLRDAENFIKHGIPVVAAVKYARGALTGAPVAASAGHLLVIVGFTKDGRVIANDPAAATNASVRRVYDRAQFERAWLGGSGTVAYIIRPEGKPLPASTGRW